MKLPDRKYFTIESIAKRLGVDIEEIEYHLSEGNLRYAFKNYIRGGEGDGWVRVSEIDLSVMKCVHITSTKKDWIILELFEEHGVAPVYPDRRIDPEFVYLPSSFPKIKSGTCIGAMNGWDEDYWGSYVMELLDGEKIIRVSDGGYPFFFRFGDNGESPSMLGVITAEELARFQPELATHDSVEPVEARSEKWFPFVPSKRDTGPMTKAIVLFGNSYYEEHGEVPSDRDLWDYMQSCKRFSTYKIEFHRKIDGVFRDIKVNGETAIDFGTWRKRVKRRRTPKGNGD